MQQAPGLLDCRFRGFLRLLIAKSCGQKISAHKKKCFKSNNNCV